jgi:hypothetical protein
MHKAMISCQSYFLLLETDVGWLLFPIVWYAGKKIKRVYY